MDESTQNPILLPTVADIEQGFFGFSNYIVSDQFDGTLRRLYPKACKCGTIFWLPKHKYTKLFYCSTTCAAIATRNREQFICDHCKQPFERKFSSKKYSKTGYRFCSRACKDAAQGIDGLVEAIRPKKYRDGSRNYRSRALKYYGAKCSQCGYDENKRMLDVDHIDSDRSNASIENLQVLCLWCHGLKTRGVPFHEWKPKR
jgi:hypothetical protein